MYVIYSQDRYKIRWKSHDRIIKKKIKVFRLAFKLLSLKCLYNILLLKLIEVKTHVLASFVEMS